LQATAFLSRLDHPIVNVTVGPNLQLRQNLGSARIAGVELRGRWSPVRAVRLSAAWTLADSRVSSADLEGRQLPQDPRHRLSGRVDVDDVRGFSGGIEVRWIGDQFEDDRNELRLPGFAVIDATISRRVGDRVTVFVAAENALDRRYLVGLQGGVATIGQPLCVRGGVRLAAF
jgi:outer membrane receptor protein involved in Fe transport